MSGSGSADDPGAERGDADPAAGADANADTNQDATRQAIEGTNHAPDRGADDVNPSWQARLADPARLGGLSDALFAIVLTLLVLDIDVPDRLLAQPLAQAEALWPSLFGYMLTFVIAGIYWSLHHRIFTIIEHVDRRLIWINLMFLLGVGLLPFPTGLLSRETDAGFTFAWTLYSVNLMLIGVTLTAFVGYAAAAGLLTPSVTREEIRDALVRNLIMPAVFALSAVVAQFNTSVATFVPILIMPAQFLWRSPSHRARRRSKGMRWMLLAFAPVFVFVAYSLWVFTR